MSMDERLQGLVDQFERAPEDLHVRRPQPPPPAPADPVLARVEELAAELGQRIAAVEARAEAAEARAAAAEAHAATAEARADDAMRIVEWLALADADAAAGAPDRQRSA